MENAVFSAKSGLSSYTIYFYSKKNISSGFIKDQMTKF